MEVIGASEVQAAGAVGKVDGANVKVVSCKAVVSALVPKRAKVNASNESNLRKELFLWSDGTEDDDFVLLPLLREEEEASGNVDAEDFPDVNVGNLELGWSEANWKEKRVSRAREDWQSMSLSMSLRDLWLILWEKVAVRDLFLVGLALIATAMLVALVGWNDIVKMGQKLVPGLLLVSVWFLVSAELNESFVWSVENTLKCKKKKTTSSELERLENNRYGWDSSLAMQQASIRWDLCPLKVQEKKTKKTPRKVSKVQSKKNVLRKVLPINTAIASMEVRAHEEKEKEGGKKEEKEEIIAKDLLEEEDDNKEETSNEKASSGKGIQERNDKGAYMVKEQLGDIKEASTEQGMQERNVVVSQEQRHKNALQVKEKLLITKEFHKEKETHRRRNDFSNDDEETLKKEEEIKKVVLYEGGIPKMKEEDDSQGVSEVKGGRERLSQGVSEVKGGRERHSSDSRVDDRKKPGFKVKEGQSCSKVSSKVKEMTHEREGNDSKRTGSGKENLGFQEKGHRGMRDACKSSFISTLMEKAFSTFKMDLKAFLRCLAFTRPPEIPSQ